jgi:arylsulfatase A-like enzyme
VAAEAAAPYRAAGLDENTSRIYGMLKNVDDNFGRLRAALKDLGLEDNTLLIFLADNGPCAGSVTMQRFMAGLRGLKGTVYENGIRVPCFMRWPRGFRAPAKIDRIAAHIDLMPTALDACGAARPEGVRWDGLSLMPLLRDPSAAAAWPDRTLFFQWDSGAVPRRGQAFAVRSQQYKLVQAAGMDSPQQAHIRQRYSQLCEAEGRGPLSIEGGPKYELFDIPSDPGETNDVAPGHPEIVAQMKRLYDAWFDDVWASRHRP